MSGRKRKKPKRGSSSSGTEEAMAASAKNGDDSINDDLKDSLDCLRRVVSEGFVKLQTDLDKLRFEFKTEIDKVKLSIKDIEKSLNCTQSEDEDFKEHFEMETKEHSKELVALKKKIANLEGRLKQEVENNIALEQYTRHENLRFNNIEEKELEDCKTVICNVLEKKLGVVLLKLHFMQSTELARIFMEGADQLLQDLSAGKTEKKSGQLEVSLKNLLHTLMHTLQRTMPGLSRRNERY